MMMKVAATAMMLGFASFARADLTIDSANGVIEDTDNGITITSPEDIAIETEEHMEIEAAEIHMHGLGEIHLENEDDGHIHIEGRSYVLIESTVAGGSTHLGGAVTVTNGLGTSAGTVVDCGEPCADGEVVTGVALCNGLNFQLTCAKIGTIAVAPESDED